MDARPAYHRDPRLRRLEVCVRAVGEAAGRPYALLDDTLCYPEGGGQPADRGLLNGVAVLDVQKGPDGIRHFLAAPVPPGPALLELDWARRFDHMQQHTGQHLLTALAQDRFGWHTTAFHLGTERCDIELDAAPLAEGALAELEAAVAEEIRAARPVSAQWVDEAGYAKLKVRSRGLPEGHSGEIRLVGIGDLDLNTCGGTHLESTAELEALCLLGTEPIRGGTRLFFAAGGRIRRRMAEHEARALAFRTLLGAPDAELVPALEAKLNQLQATQRQIRHLEEDLVEALAAALREDPAPLLDRHFEGRELGFLQGLARALAPRRVMFTATAAGQHAFLIAGAPDWDLKALGAQVAALLEGRGGGARGSYQGKAGSLLRRAEAAALLR